MAELDGLNTIVYGISLDTVGAQAAFVEQQELNFQLLSDPDGSAVAKYDVLHESKRYSSRVTFVIDKKGVLRHIDDEVSVKTHGSDVVKLVRDLQG